MKEVIDAASIVELVIVPGFEGVWFLVAEVIGRFQATQYKYEAIGKGFT
jgi:hypothetical protein